MATAKDCSLKDTTVLKKLILDNPGLPLLVFCGDDAWHDEYPYEQADVTGAGVKELALYDGYWIDKDEYEERLSDDLCGKEDYKNLSNEEYDRMIKEKAAQMEFVKAIVIYVG